jgi:hypothetical protein
MKCNKWTLALAAAGVISLGAVAAQADEAPHQVLTALSSTTLSGYVDTSAIWYPGPHQNSSYGIPGRVFDGSPDKLDSFNLEVVKLSLEKPLDEGQWSAGYKADLLFGPDANYYPTVLNGNGGSTPNTSDVGIKQAYVAMRAPVGNGLDFKMGVFDTIVGYEVFESPNNPNFSRSYGYALEPVNHTGLLASYKVADWLSLSGGVADTAYSLFNFGGAPVNGSGHTTGTSAESQKTYMGSAALTAPDSWGALGGSVLYAGVVDGQVFGRSDNAELVYVGATVKTPMKGLAVGAAWDYRNDGPTYAQAVGATTSPDSHAYSVAGYVTYSITEKLRANARVDYLHADNGTFYIDPGNNKNEFLGSTLTLDYSLWDNVVTRGEVRWDHSLNGAEPYANTKDAVTLTANIVYKF